jgi:tRNA-uridine 2-sulfurtransferase
LSGRIAVAMSGGIDSSVAAALLKEEGHDVFGVTMSLFGDETEGSSVEAAAGACAALGIEHTVLDMRQSFKKAVIGNFIDEYGAGRTPNPCVRCNERIKFGQLMKLIQVMGAAKLATGHYARVLIDGASEKYALLSALDERKDQSYFLYRLTQKQLGHIVFPVGVMTKDEVRDKAMALGLPNAQRDESQEVCFIPDDDYREFLKREWPALVEPGEFVDMGGNLLGSHEGIAFYTIGQRRGLNISSSDGRLYVIKRDPLTRRITLGCEEDLLTDGATLVEATYISDEPPAGQFEADVKIRYRTPPVKAHVVPDGSGAKVKFAEKVSGVSPGQSAVFYQGDRVLGGGVIAG